MYQIHIPSPASGLFPALAWLVWDEAPPAKGPAATATSAVAAIRARVVVRRRARMNSRLRTPKHASARKGACYAVEAAGSCSSAWYEERTSGPDATDAKPSS